MPRTLNALQVAALLVSASYGIGFLFGSGELALSYGMGGSIYGLATALGMLFLALLAGRLWRSGAPVWDLFGRAYGDGLKRCVALLSVVWMAGVLAAQIHGGVAIMTLLGLEDLLAHAVVLSCIFLASRMELRLASAVFALFLAASGAVLAYALINGSGGAIYGEAPARFAADLRTFRPGALWAIVIAVVALVCTGADYHQFVIAAKRPAAAIVGCLLAVAILVALSFLPAAVVLGLQADDRLVGLGDAKQVIPFALSWTAAPFGPAAGTILLLGVSAAALGSGAAILRAMTIALGAATGRTAPATRLTLVALLIGGVLAMRGDGIVATMVSVNVIYIGSIGVTFAALILRWPLSPVMAIVVVAAGFAASFGVYAAVWSGLGLAQAELISLTAGLAASVVVLAAHRACRGSTTSTPRVVPTWTRSG